MSPLNKKLKNSKYSVGQKYSIQLSFIYKAPNHISRHFKGTVQFTPVRIQFIEIQSQSSQIKLIKFQIGPIHGETIKRKKEETKRLH